MLKEQKKLKEKVKDIFCKNKPSTVEKDRIAGITLVALVVTVVVLLILAGVTITYVLGDHGIFKLAQDAKNKTEKAIEEEKEGMNSIQDDIDVSLGKVKIPEGLEVGSEVLYNPSGEYKWLHKYCSSTKAEKNDAKDAYDLLESETGKDFNLSAWKVLSIDEKTGKVELISGESTAGTVYLGEAQGYNNGVKLLNDACSNLYGNTSKRITARSINIQDIEKYMKKDALTGKDGAHDFLYAWSNTKYGHKVSSANTSNKNYPVIYAKEKKAVINVSSPSDITLDLSDSLDRFIERSEGTSISSNIGAITTATSIQPYQTYWTKDATFMETAFQEYTQKDNTKINYYELIIPRERPTEFWIASRAISPANPCLFAIRRTVSNTVMAHDIYRSNGETYSDSLGLFPIVTLSVNLIKPGTDGSFVVNVE